MENYSTLIIPLILDAIGLVIYFCLMADWKKKIRPSTYTMCLLFFVMILAAPMVWFSTLFLMDNPSSMTQFWIMFFAINYGKSTVVKQGNRPLFNRSLKIGVHHVQFCCTKP